MVGSKFFARLTPAQIVQCLLNTALVLVTARILTRIFQKIHLVFWSNVNDFTLVSSLLCVVVSYLFFAILAVLYEKRFRLFSAPALYGSFYFGLYLLCLVNALTFKVDEQWVLRLSCIGLVIPLFCATKKEKVNESWKFPALKLTNIFLILLVLAWLVHSVCFSFERNFDPHRALVDDESALWFHASHNLAVDDFTAAHKGAYGGAGFHPFGVPFLTALPSILLGSSSKTGLFFMPLSLMIGLVLFIRSIGSKKWAVLFFVTTLFATFNNRSWISELCYQLLYGDAWSMVAFLFIVYELFRLNQNAFGVRQALGTAFGIGLTALVKSPLAWVFPAFLPTYFWAIIKEKSLSLHQRLSLAGWGTLLAFLPYGVWKIYQAVYDTPQVHSPASLPVVLERLTAPNITAYGKIMTNIWANSPSLVYYALLSSVIILIDFKRLGRHLFAISGIFAFILILYGYIHYYNQETGDFGSPLRYLMNVILAIYFLGAMGFEKIIGWIESSRLVVWVKGLMVIGLIALAVQGVF